MTLAHRLPHLIVAVLVGLTAVNSARLAVGADLSRDDLATLVKLGIGDDVIVAKIAKDGIGFDVDDQAIAQLKGAGASDAVLQAVRDAAKPKPATDVQAVTYPDILKLLALGIDEEAIIKRLTKSPTVFTLSDEQVSELKKAGASDKLIAALRGVRPAAPTSELITDIAIIVDCSGSMRETTSDGLSKMTVARTVLTDLVHRIPDGLNVTMVIYGHEVFGAADDPRNCQAVKVARPLASLDAAGKSALAAAIGALQPTGATPIALSLRTAGEELARNNAYCGMVLLTDGVETCKGDPAGEAAALARNPKLTFGINVVGFGVKDEDNASLKAIADAGNGKYYSAADARSLADSIAAIAREIQVKAKPPEVVDTSRRALRILPPEIELPEMNEIYLVETGQGEFGGVFTKTASADKYGGYLAIPSSSKAYDVVWVPKVGKPVYLMRQFTLPERKVVDVKPESIFGMIQVKGTEPVNFIIAMPAGNKPSGVYVPTSRVDKYGEVLVVPSGKYDVYLSLASGRFATLEEDLEVEAGKMVQLQSD